MLQYTVICLFVLCVTKTDSKVCSREEVVNSVQIVSFIKTYTELRNICPSGSKKMDYDYNYNYDYYEETKTTFNCLETVMKTKMMTRYQPKRQNKTKYFCCPGYSNIDDLNSNNIKEDINCQPICDPPCQKTEFCDEPQKCRCSPGYIYTSVDASYHCLPVCDIDCGNGKCIKPNTCLCDTGYGLTNTTSHAVCAKFQHNDIECSVGYIKSDNGICTPQCSNGCVNGICISPEVCQCDPGFHLTTNNSDGSKVCRPDCDPGYKIIGGSCRAECNHSCGNGTCILPNVCECFLGYKIDITKFSSKAASNGFLCIPSCKYCIGECVAPNTCVVSTVISPLPTFISKLSNSTWSTIYQSTATSLPTRSTTWSAIRLSISSHSPSPLSTPWMTAPRSSTARSSTYWSTIPGSHARSSSQQYTEVDQIITTKDNSTKTDIRPDKSNTLESVHSKGEKTWLEHHWVSVILPVLLLLFAAIVILIVWRRKPIIVYLRGRSYVVEDDDGCYFDHPVLYSKAKANVECK